MKYNSKFFLLCVVVLLVSACANQVGLTGGEKDETPPKPLSFSPDNYSKNFESKEVKIVFDEMIQVRNTSDILVSPYIKKAPKYSTNGKVLTIEFQEALEDSLTYTIDFGKSLVDLNEGNPYEGFKYLLSTYDEIDTLEISGKVVDAFTKEPSKGFLVGVYNTLNGDTLIPVYITLTDDNGQYNLKGVREGSYFLRVFEDVNKDKLVQPNEAFGFNPNKVAVSDAVDSLQIFTSINSGSKVIYSVDYKKNKYPIIIANRAQSQWSLRHPSLGQIPGELNYRRDSFFMTDTLKEMLGIAQIGSVSDTIRFAPTKVLDSKPGRISLSLVNRACAGNRLLIKPSTVPESIDWDLISLWRDSIPIELVSKNLNYRGNLELGFERMVDMETITVRMDSGAVSAGLSSNIKWEAKASLLKEEVLSTLSFQISDSIYRKANYLVYLESTDGTVLRFKSGPDTKVVFNKILSGEYMVRLVVDKNNDGIWNSVNLDLLREPEPVLNFGPYRVEEGWDLLENLIEVR